MFLKLHMSKYFHNFVAQTQISHFKLKYLISLTSTSLRVSLPWYKTHRCSLQISFQIWHCTHFSFNLLHIIKWHKWVLLLLNCVFLINNPSQYNFFLYVYEVLIWSLSKTRHVGKFSYGVRRLPERACRTGGCTKGIYVGPSAHCSGSNVGFDMGKNYSSNKGKENK